MYAAASGAPERRLVEHVELGLALVAPGAQCLQVAQGVLGRPAAGRADRARPVPWRSFIAEITAPVRRPAAGGAGALPRESASQVL